MIQTCMRTSKHTYILLYKYTNIYIIYYLVEGAVPVEVELLEEGRHRFVGEYGALPIT